MAKKGLCTENRPRIAGSFYEFRFFFPEEMVYLMWVGRSVGRLGFARTINDGGGGGRWH